MKKEYFVLVEETKYPVLFSDEKEALLAAKAAGRAVLGLWDENHPEKIPTEIPYLVEKEEQITPRFLERLVRRHKKLPWIIAETGRLRIREFIPADWEKLSLAFCAHSQKENGQNLADDFACGELSAECALCGECPKVFADEGTFFSYISCQYPFYEYGIWAVEEREGRELLGFCGFWDGEEKKAEIGYWIFPAFRRKGYAVEAIRAVLSYAEELGKIPIFAQIRKENLPSRKLAEKLNFTLRPGQSESRKLQYQYVPYY